MRRGWIGAGIVAGILVGIGVGLLQRRPPRAPPANVLLIVVDTLRADRLGAWGHRHPTSPHLDTLAAGALRYSRASSTAPWTTPAMAALMTSQYPASLGITHQRSALPEGATTLAEVMAASGRRTGAVVSHTFCSSEWNFDQGFASFDETQILGHLGVSSAGVTEAGLAFVDADPGAPFFLWLHYFDPHFAYLEHDGHDVAPNPDYDGPIRSGMRITDLNRLRSTLQPSDLEELERLYDAEIALTDHHIGRILDHLDTLGIRDDTLVVFTADHGEEFLDHGRLGHGKTLYREVVGVPLIVDCPGWPSGVVDTPVSTVDVFPTVLDCLDLPIPDGLVGTPLGPDPVEHLVFSQTAKRNRLASVQDGDLTVIARLRKDGPRFEMYDLATDPGQQIDLAPAGGARLEALAAKVLQLQEGSEVLQAPAAEVEVDVSLETHLEALGYVEE